MKIKSKLPTNYLLTDSKGNRFEIRRGVHSYPLLDSSDPLAADQLKVLRDDIKGIEFEDFLKCDIESDNPPKHVKDRMEHAKKVAEQAMKDSDERRKKLNIKPADRKPPETKDANVSGTNKATGSTGKN